MPRTARVAPGGEIYHVINRANARLPLFRKQGDFLAFYKCLLQAQRRFPTRLLAWCIMGNHWHFVAWPHEDGELSQFFGYLGLTHATRWQVAHDVVGTGHVYQGRFRNFLVQRDEHLEWVLRYVERNPLRAGLVDRAEEWRWSSLFARLHGPDEIRALLTDWPIPMRTDWLAHVNRPQTQVEEQAIVQSLRRDRPLGDERWVKQAAARYDLLTTIRSRGRQKGWRKEK